MGSSNSCDCCGPHNGPIKPGYDEIKPIKRPPSYNINTSSSKDGEMKKGDNSSDDDPADIQDIDVKNKRKGKKAECVTEQNVSKCDSLKRIIKVINKYNEWLDSNDLIENKRNKKKLRDIDIESIDYRKYDDEIEKLIKSAVDYYSTNGFLRDSAHIKHEHHYQYTTVREECINGMNKRYKSCSNDNCFNMKHYFLRNKEEEYNKKHDPLEILTSLHIYMFHSIYISDFRIQHVHPRNAYLVATYIEKKQRKLKFKVYQNRRDLINSDLINSDVIDSIFPHKIVHLCSLYYGGKFIEDDDSLDRVSPLGLSEFIEKTMNMSTLNKVWKKLDEDGSDTIDSDEVDGILLLTVILLVATDFKDSGSSGAPRIDKSELKELMRPIGEWMKRDKMIKQPIITKEEFRSTFSEWLKEYHQTNGGIIADQEMQRTMLKKYKINDEKNGLLDDFKDKTDHHDRLVVNCEYLYEHKSLKDINTKDDDYENDSSLNPDAKAWEPPKSN